MPGAQQAPAASRAKRKKHTSVVTTGTPKHSGIPRAMVYGLFRALPGVPGLIATVACGITRKLDTSVGVSGPHDFAVRIVSLASRYQRVHRILHQRS
jgi:hypothetical protein